MSRQYIQSPPGFCKVEYRTGSKEEEEEVKKSNKSHCEKVEKRKKKDVHIVLQKIFEILQIEQQDKITKHA